MPANTPPTSPVVRVAENFFREMVAMLSMGMMSCPANASAYKVSLATDAPGFVNAIDRPERVVIPVAL